MVYDAIILGAGISGLLLASELSGNFNILTIEQRHSVPKNKYWLTTDIDLAEDSQLRQCVDSEYRHLDFVAYDDTRATIHGHYLLWDTEKLLSLLQSRATNDGVSIVRGSRFYSYRQTRKNLVVRANDRSFECRLLIDCMGSDSPIVAAKGVLSVMGHFVMTGRILRAEGEIEPIGLHNVVMHSRPTYLEIFPRSDSLVYAAMIIPVRHIKDAQKLSKEFNYIVKSSHYSRVLRESGEFQQKFFGIIPAGHIKKHSLDRVFFYGEAAHVNPATSATGLTRMLRTYRAVARFITQRLYEDRLDQNSLDPKKISYMSPMNRLFQEVLFESLLDFTSDDFKRLIEEMARLEPGIVNDLIFADFRFTSRNIANALKPASGILVRHLLRAMLKYPFSRT